MPVLDTNFLIALDEGDAAAIALLAEHRQRALFVPDVVAAEYLTDWAEPSDRAQVFAALQSDFTLTSTNPDWILAAASLRAELREQGRLVRTPDVWIAAWARMHGEPVVTRDTEDFTGLADVVTW